MFIINRVIFVVVYAMKARHDLWNDPKRLLLDFFVSLYIYTSRIIFFKRCKDEETNAEIYKKKHKQITDHQR